MGNLVKHFKLLILLLCALAASGCAYQRASSTSGQYADRGISVNTITRAGNGDLISFGRLAGSPQHEIKGVSVIHQFQTPTGVTVRLSEPEREEYRGQTSGEAVANSVVKFSSAIDSTLARYSDRIHSGATLEILIVNRNVGAYRGIRSQAGAPVSLSFLVHAPDSELVGRDAILSWWAALLENVAHELFHVYQRLAQVEPGYPQVDEEGAATIAGTCGLMDAAVAWGIFPTIDHSTAIERPESRLAFPGLAEGRFEPNMDALRQVEGVTVQGRMLGTAVLYTKFPDGSLDVANAESRESVFDYCSELLDRVPAFSLGEL